MGKFAERLHRKVASKAHNLPTTCSKLRPGERLPGGIKDMATLLKEGLEPVHAAYAFMQNFTSYFAEGMSQLPEMRAWANVVTKAEDEYMPSGPPMSPLTASYFWMWAAYDLRIGKSTDTLATCQIAMNDLLQLNPYQLDTAKKLSGSRMGIYEQIGTEGQRILLRELITDKHFICHCPTGYRGRQGELWYVRLVPPLEPQLGDYWVAMTTPYILPGDSRADWIDFLKRTMVHCDGSNDRTRLCNLLKFGLEPNYWNEFVFKAYCNYQTEAVFLTGIPDIKATLPHA
jgi:hypothetical protein